MSELGIAAARETFLTATVPFAAAWTDLFREMLADCPELRWRESGPGIGRDARIAYSSLFGRYMARAYLTACEGVRVLIPLDDAKLALRGTSYSVDKLPSEQGLQADWIGLDQHRRLVIAEAKGSLDRGVRTWHGPDFIPAVLDSAIGQAQRTAVFRTSSNQPLPAKRWAVASRWGNETNLLCPTLLAWDPDEGQLDDRDYLELARHLYRADLVAVTRALGHPEVAQIHDVPETAPRFAEEIRLRVGPRAIDPGFAALVGPVGILPLRGGDDLDRVRRIRELAPQIALVSLSNRYANAVMREPQFLSKDGLDDEPELFPEGDDRFANRAGLTVVWPLPHEDITLVDD